MAYRSVNAASVVDGRCHISLAIPDEYQPEVFAAMDNRSHRASCSQDKFARSVAPALERARVGADVVVLLAGFEHAISCNLYCDLPALGGITVMDLVGQPVTIEI